ncbi:hypothetical protein KJ853_01415 [Patescibacteria group bacterium]|nr:hypothetical protein [Patescibacteria group bacterium]
MKNIFFILLASCLLAGCAAMGPRIVIEAPSQPPAVELPVDSLIESWFFDPTLGAVKNDTGGSWSAGVYMAVWIDSQFEGPPLFQLDPGVESWPKNIPLGKYNLCAKGYVKTAAGPQSIGSFCRPFEVTISSRYGNYGWYERISAWDFPRK